MRAIAGMNGCCGCGSKTSGDQDMCGIAAIMRRSPSGSTAIGSGLLTMSACLQHRGADSAGFAVFGSPSSHPCIQVLVADGVDLPEPQALHALLPGILTELAPCAGGFTAALKQAEAGASDLAHIAERIESGVRGAAVVAAGYRLRVQKKLGCADGLSDTAVQMIGTHGIAHLRLATESRVDPAHAQPFWARGYFDIAVTHNGHITNYHRLRKRFEADGFTFGSHNDSEIIGIFLGERMAGGLTFDEALKAASVDLDGSFSFIAATATALGVARDPFATKPLLWSQTDDTLALASEPQALHHLLGQSAQVLEIKPKETRTWATE